jgi:hypothetical protein
VDIAGKSDGSQDAAKSDAGAHCDADVQAQGRSSKEQGKEWMAAEDCLRWAQGDSLCEEAASGRFLWEL